MNELIEPSRTVTYVLSCGHERIVKLPRSFAWAPNTWWWCRLCMRPRRTEETHDH